MNLLSNPSKMPGKSFSLPALKSCPWAVTAPRKKDGRAAICAGCYARPLNGSRYAMPNVKDTQQERLDWVVRCMRSYRGQQEFEGKMYEALKRLRVPYFRIHDSGDFFSVPYVESWTRICAALPHMKFWAPTKSWLTKRPDMQQALRDLNALPNVTIRPSAIYFGDGPARALGLSAGSCSGAEGKADWDCPSYKQGGKCGECRVCWDEPRTTVNYHVHGKAAVKLVQIAGVS